MLLPPAITPAGIDPVDIVGVIALSVEVVAVVYVVARGIAWWLDQQKDIR